MATPAISVIVPIYKAEAYLHKCVDGILAQTFTDFELILVDDGSPDCSGAICEDYAKKDARIRVVHKQNGGLTSARRSGLAVANGVYTLQIDPDDWVEPIMMERLHAKAMETDADMVICDFFKHCNGETSYCKQEPKSLLQHDVMREMLLATLECPMWNKLIRRSCYEERRVKLNDDMVLLEDMLICMQLLIAEPPMKIAYVPEAFYHYERNVNPNSITMTHHERFRGYADAICTHFRELLQPHEEYWRLWVEKDLSWVAYLALYYNAFSAQRYKDEFHYLQEINGPIVGAAYVRLALRNYQLGRGLIELRKMAGSLRRKLSN